MTLRRARPAWLTPCSPDWWPIRRDAAIGFAPACVRAPIWSNPAWRAVATSLRLCASYDPANRDLAEAMLVANNRDMTPTLAKQSYDLLLADAGGIRRDVARDPEGIRSVLRLRSTYGMPRKVLPDPAPYVDLSYYERAFGKP